MKQKGFTLVELVVVIVVLGIVAAVAAPKYVDLSRDARIAVIDTVYASVQSAANQTQMKAILNGVEKEPKSNIVINGTVVEAKYGYPEARADDGGHDIIDLVEIGDELFICNDNDHQVAEGSDCDKHSTKVSIGYDLREDIGCYVDYHEPEDSDPINAYQLSKFTDGC